MEEVLGRRLSTGASDGQPQQQQQQEGTSALRGAIPKAASTSHLHTLLPQRGGLARLVRRRPLLLAVTCMHASIVCMHTLAARLLATLHAHQQHLCVSIPSLPAQACRVYYSCAVLSGAASRHKQMAFTATDYSMHAKSAGAGGCRGA
jgi:hypothetical protein